MGSRGRDVSFARPHAEAVERLQTREAQMRVRALSLTALLLSALSLGCRTVDDFVINTPKAGDRSAAVQDRSAVVRETLASFGLRQVPGPSYVEEWLDPGPPELRVTMRVGKRQVELRLEQKHGPQGHPPLRFRELEKALLKNVNERFGKGTMWKYVDADNELP